MKSKFKFSIDNDMNMCIKKDSESGFTLEEIHIFIETFIHYGALSEEQAKLLCIKLNLLDEKKD